VGYVLPHSALQQLWIGGVRCERTRKGTRPVAPLAGATQEAELGQLAAGQAAPPGGIAATGREMLVARGARPGAHPPGPTSLSKPFRGTFKISRRTLELLLGDSASILCIDARYAGQTVGPDPTPRPQVTLERQPGEDAAHPSRLSAQVVCEDVGGGH
jgi:hypothetical protein